MAGPGGQPLLTPDHPVTRPPPRRGLDQVSILNEEFGWSDAEVDRARRMVAAYDAAKAKGIGAVAFEGKMIDVPVVERAQALIRQAERQRARRPV